MKNFSKAMLGGLAMALIGMASTAQCVAEDAQPFRFKFELNKPLLFSAVSDTKTITDRSMQVDGGTKSAATTNVVQTRYKLRLTPVKISPTGIWTLHYEPFDFEEDLDTAATGGHVASSIHGLDVKSTQNGITVVDTVKGVGLAQAKAFKQGVYSRMMSGYFEFQPSGVISKVEGDLPFVDYWTESIRYQIGFFDIVFPNTPVPAGGTWSTNLAVKDLQGIRLGDTGLVETNVFVCQNTPDATASKNLVPIAVSMLLNSTNLLGSMDAGGQNTMLNISEFTHHKNGTYLFDAEAGCLNKGDETETVRMAMDMLVQGHTMSVVTDLSIHSKFDLIKN